MKPLPATVEELDAHRHDKAGLFFLLLTALSVLVPVVGASLKSTLFIYVRGFFILRRRSVICFRYHTQFFVLSFNYRARMRIVTHSFRC